MPYRPRTTLVPLLIAAAVAGGMALWAQAPRRPLVSFSAQQALVRLKIDRLMREAHLARPPAGDFVIPKHAIATSR